MLLFLCGYKIRSVWHQMLSTLIPGKASGHLKPWSANDRDWPWSGGPPGALQQLWSKSITAVTSQWDGNGKGLISQQPLSILSVSLPLS